MKQLLLIAFSVCVAFGQAKDVYPRKQASYTVATLPTPTANSTAIVTDGATASDCTVGGGSTRVWCVYSGSAWVSIGGSAAPFSASITSSTVLAITGGISRVGTVPTTTAASTATLSGSTASSTAYGYIDSAGVPTIGHNGAATITSAQYTVVGGITAFPAGSQPLFEVTYVSNIWTAVTNRLANTSRSVLTAGSGVTIAENAGGDQVISASGGYAKYQQEVYFGPGGSTDGGTALSSDILCDTSSGCTMSALAASGRQWVVNTFADSGTTTNATFYYRIPEAWDAGTVSLTLIWTRSSGSGTNMVWSVQTVCAANNEDVLGSTYNTAQTATTAAPTLAQRATTTISSLTMTGCAAGESLMVRPSRASGNASDDLAANVYLLGAVLSFKVNLTN